MDRPKYINQKIQKKTQLICISVFDPQAKHDLVLGGETLVGNHRGQTFLVVGHQVCTHLRRDFGPHLFTNPF